MKTYNYVMTHEVDNVEIKTNDFGTFEFEAKDILKHEIENFPEFGFDNLDIDNLPLHDVIDMLEEHFDKMVLIGLNKVVL